MADSWIAPELAGYLEAMTDTQVVSLVLAGEARSEQIDGQAAVANTIRNRVKAESWFGDSYRAVCLKPWQFSCLSVQGGKNNYRFVRSLARQFAAKTEITDENVLQCIGVATLLMTGKYLKDNTHGATHYHVYSMSPKPAWAKEQQPVARIGTHWFYNTVK